MLSTKGNNPETGEWNDSLRDDYLWSNVNFGEAVTEAMTPLTWSVIQFTLDDWVFLPGFSTVGNIGGRPYLNISIFATLFNALGRNRKDLLDYTEGTLYMHLPQEMEIPLIPLSRWALLSSLPRAARVQIKGWWGSKTQKSYLETNQDWFHQARERIQGEQSQSHLKELWGDEIRPHIKRGVWCVLGSATSSSNFTMQLRRDLSELVGPDDAHVLIANLSENGESLESIGPMISIGMVARGEMSMANYLKQYGHRGPQEFELSVPHPAEDPRWFNNELAKFQNNPIYIETLLARQGEKYDAAWARLGSRYPGKTKEIGRRLDESARRARIREVARSEYIRDRWIVRLFALRVGALTGLGDDIFFMSLDEVLDLLDGDKTAISTIPLRKETYFRYKSLPPYPSVIRGRFDPINWATDPQRRTDIYDGTSLHETTSTEFEQSKIITGSPGSAGQIEGTIRILDSPEQGDQLQVGEILVAVQTDIAWTLLFPRTAAVITDVGAPLSHAAIVARELGIPAVVGCGNATARLKNGDRVRLDGARGVIEILNQQN